MIKKLFILSMFFLGTVMLWADDKPIEVNQLPAQARTFISENFKKVNISFAKKEVEDLVFVEYDVFLSDGTKLSFDSDGKWKKIDGQRNPLPSSVIPQQIADYVKKQHPGNKILEIEHERFGYEIKLDNKIEIRFNNEFKVIDYDD